MEYVGTNSHYFSRHSNENEAATLPKLLLDRGASLYHKNRDERQSSIAALEEFIEIDGESMALSELRPYMCCFLLYQPEISGVIFDPNQVMKLSCLAMRRIPRSK